MRTSKDLIGTPDSHLRNLFKRLTGSEFPQFIRLTRGNINGYEVGRTTGPDEKGIVTVSIAPIPYLAVWPVVAHEVGHATALTERRTLAGRRDARLPPKLAKRFSAHEWDEACAFLFEQIAVAHTSPRLAHFAVLFMLIEKGERGYRNDPDKYELTQLHGAMLADAFVTLHEGNGPSAYNHLLRADTWNEGAIIEILEKNAAQYHALQSIRDQTGQRIGEMEKLWIRIDSYFSTTREP